MKSRSDIWPLVQESGVFPAAFQNAPSSDWDRQTGDRPTRKDQSSGWGQFPCPGGPQRVKEGHTEPAAHGLCSGNPSWVRLLVNYRAGISVLTAEGVRHSPFEWDSQAVLLLELRQELLLRGSGRGRATDRDRVWFFFFLLLTQISFSSVSLKIFGKPTSRLSWGNQGRKSRAVLGVLESKGIWCYWLLSNEAKESHRTQWREFRPLKQVPRHVCLPL